MYCQCGKSINQDRLEFLEATGRPLRCQECASEPKKVCFMEYGHKTAPGMVVVSGEESVRLAIRAYRRAR